MQKSPWALPMDFPKANNKFCTFALLLAALALNLRFQSSAARKCECKHSRFSRLTSFQRGTCSRSRR